MLPAMFRFTPPQPQLGAYGRAHARITAVNEPPILYRSAACDVRCRSVTFLVYSVRLVPVV